VKAWRERLLDEEYYAVFLDGTFLSIRRGKTSKEPVYLALGIKPDGHREILGFWLFGSEGESARNWEGVLKELRRRGVRKVRIFITDDLPGLEEAIRKIFPESDPSLCAPCRTRCPEQGKEEGPGSPGGRFESRVPGGNRRRGEGSVEETAGALGKGLPASCGPLGGESLCSSCLLTPS